MICEMADDNIIEAMSNKVLLLYSLKQLREYGSIDKWKVQKTCFITQLDGGNKRIKVLNYQFFKWTHGPMSAYIVEDMNILNKIGFVSTNGPNQELTEKGMEAVDQFEDFINQPSNRPAIDFLDGWIYRIGNFSGKQLRDMSHKIEMPYLGEQVRIEDIPDGTPLLRPMKSTDFDFSFRPPADWMDTLEILFSLNWPEIEKTLRSPSSKEDFLDWSGVFGTR